jgi:hypothetical protein
LAAVEGITDLMMRSESRTDAIEFEGKLVTGFVRRFSRGIWLAFLALALLAVSIPSAAGVTTDRSPAVTSKLINTLAIRQDIPSSLILDSRSKPRWSRAAERSGAIQSSGGYGIVPAAVRMAVSRPYPSISRSVHDVADPPRFHHFDAQAPPLSQ